MPFKKGKSGNPSGRPRGAKGERTKEWENLGEHITTKHADRFNRILDEANDEKFTSLYLQTLEYFRPKQSRSDDTQNIKQEINVNFRRRD